MAAGKLYVARQNFVVSRDGRPVRIVAGKTVVREGHPVMKGRESLFEELTVHYEVEAPKRTEAPVEQATAAPGEKRRAAPPKQIPVNKPKADADDE